MSDRGAPGGLLLLILVEEASLSPLHHLNLKPGPALRKDAQFRIAIILHQKPQAFSRLNFFWLNLPFRLILR